MTIVYQVHEVTDWNLNCPNPAHRGDAVNGGHYEASRDALIEVAEGGELLTWMTCKVPTFATLHSAKARAEGDAASWWRDAREFGQFSNEGDDPGEFPGVHWEANPDLGDGQEGFRVYTGTIRGFDQWHWLCRVQLSELLP